jgi:NADP-dependent 3-hydroxy acid dehydrogenase YdfG
MGSALQGKVVVVTGASAGVGRATAVELGRRGARVALLARGTEGLEGARREVVASGGEALVLPTDVADPDAVEAAAAAAEAQLGPIDVWVNNAMAAVFGLVADTDARDLARVTAVTYLGSVYGTMAALARMRPRGRGTIVQVSSALSYRGIPLQAGYCGAKHAQRGFTESLRTELLAEGSAVRVTSVLLPALNTTQFGLVRVRTPRMPRPVAPVYEPEVAARAIVHAAAHPGRREWFVGTPTVTAVWGNKLAAGVADRYLARTGIEGQQTDEPVTPRRRATDYLDAPVPGDHGCRGPFGDETRKRSLQAALSRRRGALAGGAVAAGSLTALWRALRSSS